jgi:ankyrin repeat protein
MVDADGRTSLMHAVMAGDSGAVASLIDRGADVNAVDHDQRWTALHFAARDHNEELVRLLLEAGAEVDPEDVFGDTPLWRAVMTAGTDLAAMRVLLGHGADPGRKNRHGISPLDLARESGREDVVALLLHPATE